ncbi:MAG: ATP-binding protein [Leadbetterella sp.]|nr:ATP-binding protein [Leadbetterella sp.]
MLLDSQISEVAERQKKTFLGRNTGVSREKRREITLYENFVTVITGVRRGGKSTLMLQLLEDNPGGVFFLNFEDPRLAGFDTDDFSRLDMVIEKTDARILFFDEIQMLTNWELYVRQKLDEGFRIVVTGSNATLLSRELGTKLTGRNLPYELFPFSYREFLAYASYKNSDNSAWEYLENGGFPEYLKTGNGAVLNRLLEDILMKDIAVRYGLRDVNSLRQLAVYLLSNIGKPVSATGMKNLFDIRSPATILEYFSYLENTYVVQFLPKFSYSLKVQIRNPRKVYAIDMGLFTHNSIVFTDEAGRRLENTVYLHIRRKYTELYYFQDQRECDFIAIHKGRPAEILQVCYELTDLNKTREFTGLKEALDFFKEEKGRIITFNQKDTFKFHGKVIEVVPLTEFLLE